MVTHSITKREQDREAEWARVADLCRRSRAMAARVAEDEAAKAHNESKLL